MRLTEDMVRKYKDNMEKAEKSKATIEKYLRDITAFSGWVKNGDICRDIMPEYKAYLLKRCAAKRRDEGRRSEVGQDFYLGEPFEYETAVRSEDY